LKYALRQRYHKILDLWKNFDDLLPTGVVSQITNNLGNLNMVLMDALQTECPDTVANFRSVTFLDDFGYRTKPRVLASNDRSCGKNPALAQPFCLW
jgi:hypothetical protein